MNSEQAQYEKMIETPIHKLIPTLAVPTIISMLVTAVYNAADTYFVALLGTTAAAAVGIVFSLMSLIQTIGFTVGIGGGSMISRFLGNQQAKKAEEVANSGVIMGFLFGIVFAIIGFVFVTPFMRLLGATDTILPYAVDYAKYILIACPFMMCSFILNNLLRSEGKAKFSMIGIVAGVILNIVLDPLLIFTFHMGIAGAAIATGISQCLSFCLLLSAYLRGKTIVEIHPSHISRSISTYGVILKNGMPSFFRQGLVTLANIALNFQAGNYGDSAVAAMSIVGKVFFILIAIVVGYGQGFQPVAGYNYGAKRYDRLKKAIYFSLIVCVVGSTVMATGCYFGADLIMSWFSKDQEVLSIGRSALHAQCLALPVAPVSIICNMTFQSVGKPLRASITSSMRQGIFFIPIILLLPRWIGLSGVIWAQALADFCSFIAVIPFMIYFFREIKQQEHSHLVS